MFKIAVCDDEKELRDWMAGIIHRSGNGLWQFCSVDQYSSGEALCKAMEAGAGYQLVFLDIELESMDGVEAGRYIRSRLDDHAVQIVYISGKMGYAMSLFQNQPYDFLVKPLDEGDVVRIIKRVIEINVGMDQTVHFVSAGKQKNVVCCKDIQYAYSTVRKVTIHTAYKDFEMYGKLSDLAARLPEADFISTHKSYLVNWLHIHSIQKDSVVLHDGTTIPVSRNYKNGVHEAWLKRMEAKHDYT